MTGFSSIHMCIVMKSVKKVTFWDISQKQLVKHSTFLSQKHSTHHDE